MDIQWVITACRERAPNVYKMVWVLRNAGIEPTVVWDETRSGSWWNKRKAFQAIEAPWGIVIEDDLYIPEVGPENARRVIEQGNLDCMASYCLVGGDQRYRKVYAKWKEQGLRYIKTSKVDGQAIAITREAARAQIDFDAEYIDPKWKHLASDRSMWWLDFTGRRSFHTIPSIFGTIRMPSMCGHMVKGRDTSVIEVADSVLDWTRTEENTGEWYEPHKVWVYEKRFKPGKFADAMDRFEDTARK